MPIDGRHRERNLAVPDEICELVAAPLRVDRHDRHAERIQRQPVKQELRAVEEQEPGSMAVTIAGTRVNGAQALHLARDLLIRVFVLFDAVRRRGARGDVEERPLRPARRAGCE